MPSAAFWAATLAKGTNSAPSKQGAGLGVVAQGVSLLYFLKTLVASYAPTNAAATVVEMGRHTVLTMRFAGNIWRVGIPWPSFLL